MSIQPFVLGSQAHPLPPASLLLIGLRAAALLLLLLLLLGQILSLEQVQLDEFGDVGGVDLLDVHDHSVVVSEADDDGRNTCYMREGRENERMA